MIRKATTADIGRMVELGAIMHAESPRFSQYQFLPERLALNIERVMNMPGGCVLVGENQNQSVIAGILAVAVPHYACDFVQACDMAFFVHPAHRGGTIAARLVAAYRGWADSLGAEPNMGINTGVTPERTGKFIAATGAVQTGTTWTWGASQHVH